jgi:predicted MFS family arabinose efflux permease
VGNSRLRDPLRRPAFRRLAISFAINEMGDWLGLIALSVLVFDRTDSAMATAALFLGTGVIPALLTPVVVARLERPPPRFVLPTIYAAEAAAFLALALLADHFSLAAVVAVAAIDGALALTAKTLTRAVTAAMLEPEGELRAGNAILNVAFTGGAAIGPAAGGGLVAAFGVQSALLLDAVSFYVIAWILFTTRPLPQAEPEPGRLREQVRAGLAYIRDHGTLQRLIGAEALALVFFSAVVPIEVVYAKDSLGASDTGYGVLLGSWGIGMLVGSLVFAKLRRAPLPFLLLCSTLAIAGGYLGMAAAPTLAVACVASVVGGTGNGVQWVTMVSAVQELTSASMQARVISVLESISAALPAVGFVLGGFIATAYSPRAAFAFAGIGVVVVVAFAIPLLGSKWPVHAATERADPAEDDVMVELIPAMPADGRSSPTWRS